ncbi:MAG TPA: hypothetical protein VIX63_10795 [Vicinamibacterales bacterium]
MRATSLLSLAVVALVSMPPLAAMGDAQNQQAPTVKIPQPGVPQIMTLEGTYVRVAYNNEGYAIIGYRLANLSIGEEWMLLEFGTTIRDRVPNYTMKRDALSLETPDGKTIPLASVVEYRKANLTALQNREKVQRDSINYFPPSASQACRVGFFSELDNRAIAFDQVELSSQRGCVGRLFFQVPGGIAYGQHWLNVKFEKSLVRVPFRILTKEEEKLLSKNYKDIRQQVQDAFRPKT